MVVNVHPTYQFSLLTAGRLNDGITPSACSVASMVAPFIGLPSTLKSLTVGARAQIKQRVREAETQSESNGYLDDDYIAASGQHPHCTHSVKKGVGFDRSTLANLGFSPGTRCFCPEQSLYGPRWIT